MTTDLWFPDYMGGTARVARESAIALRQVGHDVVVLAPATKGKPAVESIGGVEVRRIVRRFEPLPRTYTDCLSFAAALVATGLSPKDIVLAHHPTNASAAAAVVRILHSRLVYVFHASPYREARYRRAALRKPSSAVRSLFVEPALRRLEGISANSATTVLTLSEFSRQILIADHPSAGRKTVVVGGGVDAEKFRPATDRPKARGELGFSDRDIVLLTVRRFVPRMGLDIFLDAVAALAGKFQNVRAVVVGDGELRNELETRRDALGLAKRVAFTGRLSDEATIRLYQAADLFVLPSVAYEGFGMVTAEALACGTPVVGTTIGATAEIIGKFDRSLLANPDSSSLEATITNAVRRLSDRSRSEAREFAERTLSWGYVIQEWDRALTL